MKFQSIKGVRDILPPETALWNRVEQTARGVFGTYGFGEIRLPIFEETDLFARSIGADTDVVAKEMYTFVDRDSESISLAAGGYGIGGARVHRAWDAHAARKCEAILHRADVPAREAAEGALPAVLSDWRGGAGAFGRAGESMRK